MEELVAALYDLDEWITVARHIRVYGEDTSLPPCPLARIRAITTIHFPRFQPQAEALEQAVGLYEVWMLKKATERLEGKIATLNDGVAEFHGPYRTADRAFLEAAQKFAKNELK